MVRRMFLAFTFNLLVAAFFCYAAGVRSVLRPRQLAEPIWLQSFLEVARNRRIIWDRNQARDIFRAVYFVFAAVAIAAFFAP